MAAAGATVPPSRGDNGAAHLAELLRELPPNPTVEAKELESIVLLKRRQGLSRLDMGPFAVLYALITLQLLYSAINGQW